MNGRYVILHEVSARCSTRRCSTVVAVVVVCFFLHFFFLKLNKDVVFFTGKIRVQLP